MEKKKIRKKRSELIEGPERKVKRKVKKTSSSAIVKKKKKEKLSAIEELETQLKQLKKEIVSTEGTEKKLKKRKKKRSELIEEPAERVRRKKKKRPPGEPELKRRKKKRPPEGEGPELKRRKKRRSPEEEKSRLKKRKKKVSGRKEGEDEIEYYKRLLAEDPSKIGVKLVLGKLYYKRKDYKNAEKYLLEYVTKKDTSAEAYRLLGHAYYAQGLETPAANMYEKSAAIDPEATDLKTKAEKIKRKHKALNSYITQAKTNLMVGEIEEAIALYKKASKLSPGEGLLYFNIGELYERLGDIPSAYENYQNAVLISPANLKYQKKFHQIKVDRGEIGLSDMDEGNFKHIVYLLKNSIAEKEDEHNNLCRLGELYLNQGMYREAQSQFSQALMVLMSSRAYRGQALVYWQLGEIKRAIISIKSALKLDRTNEKAQQILVELYAQLGEDPERIFSELITLLNLPPDSPNAVFYKGILLEGINWQKAIAHYQSVLEAEEDFVEAYYRMGSLIIHHDLLEEAEMMLKEALNRDKEHYRAITAMGRLAIVKGDIDSAEDYLVQALSLNSMHYEASLLLSKILMAKGDLEGSIYFSEKADKTAPNTPDYHLERAGVYILQTDLVNAIKSYAKSISAGLKDKTIMKRIVSETIQVNDYTLYKVLSEALVKQKDIENLKTIYSQMLKLKPDEVKCRINLSRLYRLEDDYETAINLIKDLCMKEPAGSTLKLELGEAYYNLAESLVEKEEYEKAQQALRNAIYHVSWVEINEEVIEKIKNFFTARKFDTIKKPIMNQRFAKDELLAKLKRVTTNPKELNIIFSNAKTVVATEKYHLLLGDIYAKTSYHSKAIELYFNALQINPKNPIIFYKSAQVFDGLKDYKEAADSYSEALALDDQNPVYYDRLSELKLEMKEYQEAAQIAAKALTLSSAEPELKEKLKERKNIAESKIWVMFKKDTHRQSYNPSEKTSKIYGSKLKQKWNFKINGKVSSSPVMSDGIVYAGSENTRLYSLNKDDGRENWNFNTNGQIKATPVIQLNHIYLASNGGYLYCVDKRNLHQKWLFETKSGMSSSPLIADDTLYIGSDNGIIYALFTETGEVKWEYDAKKAITTSPVINDKAIYFGTREGTFQAIEIEEGKELWAKEISEEGLQSSPAIFEGILYFGTPDKRVLAIQKDSGDTLWEFETEGEVTSSPAIGYNKVFIGSADKNIYALDLNTGSKIWNYKTGGEVFSSPAVDRGTVYAGCSEGNLYKIDIHSMEVEEESLGSAITSCPAIADGMLFIGTEENGIYAFDLYGNSQ